MLKQMFVWTIARLSAETYEVAAPGFAMALPTKSAFWHSQAWKSFRAAYNVTLAKGQPDVMLATTVDVSLPDGPWEQRAGDGSWTWTPEFQVFSGAGLSAMANSHSPPSNDGTPQRDDQGGVSQMDTARTRWASTLSSTMSNLCGGKG